MTFVGQPDRATRHRWSTRSDLRLASAHSREMIPDVRDASDVLLIGSGLPVRPQRQQSGPPFGQRVGKYYARFRRVGHCATRTLTRTLKRAAQRKKHTGGPPQKHVSSRGQKGTIPRVRRVDLGQISTTRRPKVFRDDSPGLKSIVMHRNTYVSPGPTGYHFSTPHGFLRAFVSPRPVWQRRRRLLCRRLR